MHIAFVDGWNRTQNACAESQCTIHYSIASQRQKRNFVLFARSDTESAEDNSPAVATEAPGTETGNPIESEDTTDTKEETAKRGPTVAARFSNLFAAVKKTVASKGTNAKDKYAAAQDQGEADAKVTTNY